MQNDRPVWLITGCSSGFGREIVRALLARGRRVVATARKPETLAEFTTNDGLLIAALDVNAPQQIADVVQRAEARFGHIDVLVNNAGYGYLAAIEEGEDAEIRAMFDTNVFGLAAMTRAVLPGMRQRRSGHIVNISSMGGLVGFAGVGYYNATKFAVEGLTEALAKEVEPLGIRVTAVEPGPFRTDWAGAGLRMTQHASPTTPIPPAPGVLLHAATTASNRATRHAPPPRSSPPSRRQNLHATSCSDGPPMTPSTTSCRRCAVKSNIGAN